MTLLEKAQRLQELAGQGPEQCMKAFEELYHDDVTVTEIPTGEVRKGKDAQREALGGFFSSIKEWHDGGILSVCSDEANNITTAETWMDVTFQDGNRWKMAEVAVQKWKDGQIIDEKFYYNAPEQ